jgi:hypothetical protein
VIDLPQVRIIDYDALRQAGNERDLKRFLANWSEQPELLARWQKALSEASL